MHQSNTLSAKFLSYAAQQMKLDASAILQNTFSRFPYALRFEICLVILCWQIPPFVSNFENYPIRVGIV